MNVYRYNSLGISERGWLHSHFHFSFAEYFNPQRMSFGPLRVINDDIVEPHSGFPTHAHENMEIFTYIIDGELTHKDSKGNQETLFPGEVQYMSAGTGIQHSEYNHGENPLRLLQIWIRPNRNGHAPNYGSKRFPMEDREDRWLHLVSPPNGSGGIHIHQDANIYARIVGASREFNFTLLKSRQAYIVVVDGTCNIQGKAFFRGDGIEIMDSVQFVAKKGSHFLIIEMEKDHGHTRHIQ
jgi:redox-sensitive bicupin YhaK (pirin superfamily)